MPYIIIMTRKENAKKEKKDTPKSFRFDHSEDLITNPTKTLTQSSNNQRSRGQHLNHCANTNTVLIPTSMKPYWLCGTKLEDRKLQVFYRLTLVICLYGIFKFYVIIHKNVKSGNSIAINSPSSMQYLLWLKQAWQEQRCGGYFPCVTVSTPPLPSFWKTNSSPLSSPSPSTKIPWLKTLVFICANKNEQ